MVRQIDLLLRKGLILALLLSCSFHILKVSIGESRSHASLIYLDLPVAAAIGLLALLGAFTERRRHGGPASLVPALLPLLALFAWWLTSGLATARRTDFLLASLLHYFGILMLVLSARSLLARRGLAAFALDSVLRFGIVLSIFALLQGLAKPSRLFEDVTSTLSPNHAHVGLYMMVVLAVALFRAKQREGRLPWVAAFLAFLTILLSGSRAAQLGCLPILYVHFVQRISFANALKIMLVIAIVAGTLHFIVERRQNSHQQNTEFQVSKDVKIDMSAGRRLLMWVVSWKVINSSPERFLWGIGFTNYRWEYGRLIVLPFYTNAAHNIYIHLWTETGLIGLLLYLAVYLGLWLDARRWRSRAPESAFISALLLGTMLSGFTQETLYPNEAFGNMATFFFFGVCVMLLQARMVGAGGPEGGEPGRQGAPAAGGDAPGRVFSRPALRAGATLLVAALAAPPALAGELRVAMNLALSGPMTARPDDSLSARKRSQLEYFARLGFTHVLYSLGAPEGHGDPAALFRRETEKGWTYNDGRYAEGPMAESFTVMKAEIERRGMRLIPFIETFTHVHHLIALDSTISEFADWRGYCGPRGMDCGPLANHVATIGTEPGKATNPGAEQFFREYLRIVKANWGKTALGGPAPAYLNIGHDEMGTVLRGSDGHPQGVVSFVKAGRSSRRSETAAELVALEVDARIRQATIELAPGIRIMLYGDSFLPGDNGEVFGLSGDPETGEGGALRILRDRHGLGPRLVIIPWGYSWADGEPFLGTRARIDKGRQLHYLDRLGLAFVVGTGEDGGASEYHPVVEPTKRALYEWVVAAEAHPRMRLGYAHFTFDDPSRCHDGTGLCVDWTAPLLAYLVWNRPGHFKPFAGKYSDKVFAGVDYGRSVREKDWRAAVHFIYPEVQSRPWWKFW